MWRIGSSYRLVLGRIDQGNRRLGVIEKGNPVPHLERTVIQHISGGRKQDIHRPLVFRHYADIQGTAGSPGIAGCLGVNVGDDSHCGSIIGHEKPPSAYVTIAYVYK